MKSTYCELFYIERFTRRISVITTKSTKEETLKKARADDLRPAIKIYALYI